MQGLQELSKALHILGQQILERQELDSVTLIRDLLIDIDKIPFKSLFNRWGCKDYASLRQALDNYYQTSFEQVIRWDSRTLIIYSDDFIETFVFVLDLALKNGKNAYIELILSMNEAYQETLQPFVKAVTERDNFIEKIEGEKNDDNLFELLEENQKLKKMCQENVARYQEAKIQYDDLKISFDRVTEELHLLKVDHQFINEVGGSGTVQEAVEKIKKDYQQYEKIIEKMKKQIEQKKLQLSQRDEQISQLNFKVIRYYQKVQQLQKANQLIDNLNTSLNISKNEEETIRIELEKCKEFMIIKDEQIRTLTVKVNSLQIQAEKFENIRRLHGQYRDKLLPTNPPRQLRR